VPNPDRAPPGLKKGDRVQLSNGMSAIVADVDAAKGVTIDLNPELAGAPGGGEGRTRAEGNGSQA
jgi:hypothetical protein